ncbi:hypothetical protein Tco_0940602 [Tanacetum coccineum]|uniref:Uncharacterized protein n=1 Tax=Tanacetum coccineum TaxID=301880 RepID=A0ABQ5DNS6_9ASTR
MSPRRSEGEESEYSFFEGDGSYSGEWRDYGMSSDDYERPPVFDDDQYKDVIEEEEGFVDNYLNFQKDETNVSFSGVVLGVEEESMLVYDTDIEDAIEDEKGFVGKRGFGEEEDNMEDVVVMTNDFCSSKIQNSSTGNQEPNGPSNDIVNQFQWRNHMAAVPLVKVRWNSRRGPEFTMEREDSFKQKYPQLFTNRASSSTTRS